MTDYVPSGIITVVGGALLTFGILAETTSATVGGVVLGAMILAVGIASAIGTMMAREIAWREIRASEATVDAFHREQDRSRDVKAPRSLDDLDGGVV